MYYAIRFFCAFCAFISPNLCPQLRKICILRNSVYQIMRISVKQLCTAAEMYCAISVYIGCFPVGSASLKESYAMSLFKLSLFTVNHNR